MTNLDVDVAEAESQDAPVELASEGIEAPEGLPEAEAAPAEPIDYLDTSDIGDRFVKLTVDGEEQSVPLNEVLKGYNSNAAATKRFQEASAIREEAQSALNLAQAVSSNPGMTMQILASQAGLTVEQFLDLSPQQQHDVAASAEPEPQFDNPYEAALYQEHKARIDLERRFEEREQLHAAEGADRELAEAVSFLQNQYGASMEDARAVVGQAWQMSNQTDQYVGPEMFPMIYQAQQYQKSQAIESARGDAQAASEAERAARQAAAASASNQVGMGSGAVGTAPAQVVSPMNAEQAIEAALDSLGIQ